MVMVLPPYSPSRIASMGRIGPDPAVVAKDLERLFSGKAPEAPGENLDFSKPG
jgi:hypothetical protein